MKNKMDTEKKKRLLISLIVIFGTIIIIATGYIVIKWWGDSNGKKRAEEVQASYASGLPVGTTNANGVYPLESDVDDTGNGGANSQEPVENMVNFEDLTKENSDVYSWIYIPDTNISLPVLQSTDDDNFYLDHDIYKDYSFPGAIYSQSKNKKDYSDRVTVLYGHNMANGSMFANLHYYMDDNFFDTHKYIYIYTPDRKLTYQVVSAYEYDNRHILNSYDFSDNAVFGEWLDAAKNPHSLYSKVNDDVKLDLNSKMLVLSTCMNSGDNRFIVQGVLVKDEKAV